MHVPAHARETCGRPATSPLVTATTSMHDRRRAVSGIDVTASSSAIALLGPTTSSMWHSPEDHGDCQTMFLYNLLVLVLVALAVTAIPIPDYIGICARNDPKLNDCVTKSVMGMRAKLAAGIPELKIPSIEPLVLGDMLALEGAGLVLNTFDVQARDCSKFEISDVNVNPTEKISFKIRIPVLHVSSRYDVSGEVMSMPLSGSGPMEGEFDECLGDVELKMKKSGDKLALDSMSAKITVGGGRVSLENLGSDASISAAANELLNSNFKFIVNAIMPSIEKALNEKIGDIVSKVFDAFTYDQLFPPTK